MPGPRPRRADSRLDLLLLCTLGLSLLAGAARADDELAHPGGQLWVQAVQPQLAARCGACHVGARFAFASLERSGPDFSAEETRENYDRFLDLVSLDAPEKSRLLAKALGDGDADGLPHAAGRVLTQSDPFYKTLLDWIQLEKSERCPDCGAEAPLQYVAYVLAPRMFWALERDPIRDDHGLRDRARIMLQPLRPGTLTPVGKPVDFLGDGFCGADGRCDFGHLAANHAGTALVFECRLDPDGADWVNEVRWNVCIAEIGPDGRAVNPRFLQPPERRQRGETVARSDPFGLLAQGGDPLKGHYDLHFRVRRRQDATPVFGPDDQSVYFASRGPDPRTGIDATQTYHGTEHLDNIVRLRADGKLETVYSNEGGVADLPFFLRNGRIAFHTWNLERMDRHMYVQSTPEGMMELPVLLGRVQGENMWGKATELANGAILGMTGRRRSSIDNYVPFLGDHTLGTGIDPTLEPVKILDPKVFEQIRDFPDGYCNNPPDGQNCIIDAFYADPSYAPDGRAFISYNPDRTYVLQGEELYLAYAHGDFNNLYPYTPTRLGVSLIDRRGQLTRVLDPPNGYMLRYPAWVGRSQPPRDTGIVTEPIDEPRGDDDLSGEDEEGRHKDLDRDWADVHIADLPLWLSFADGPDDQGGTSKARLMDELDRIVSLRVLSKEMDGNACLNDGLPYRYAVNANFQDHPSAFGINNATGYRRLDVPKELGGDAYGDVPLEADRSVRVRVPARELLLFQGIDADGHVVRQHARVFAMPSQQAVNTSVKRDQYPSQCSSCHGTIAPGEPYKPLSRIDEIPFVPLSFDTLSVGRLVDLTDGGVPRRSMTYREALRPLLDAACVSCHSGAQPAGQLSLEASYSKTANFPAGKWATEPGLALPEYMRSVPQDKRVPGYNYSLNYAWLFKDDESDYRNNVAYAPLIARYAPLAALAPWDPAYQNLYANDGQRLVYLSGFYDSNFGRGDRLGGNSSDSWLIEILTGRDLDPTRGKLKLDHTHFLSANQIRDFMAVIDLGFPYTSRCDDRTVTEGPNAGQPWGDPKVRQR